MNRLAYGFLALVFSVLLVVGVIAAVTIWIPHGGAHGHAPTTLGYIAAYCLLVLIGAAAALIVGGCWWGAFVDD